MSKLEFFEADESRGSKRGSIIQPRGIGGQLCLDEAGTTERFDLYPHWAGPRANTCS